MIRTALFLAAILFFLNLSGSMPGWLTFTDPDDNTYYVTPHGKIYTSEKPDYTYKPVSKDGITYYLAQGETLIHGFNPYEGLMILKSVRLLASYDESLQYAGARATGLINMMRKDQGSRFDNLDERASLLLCRVEDTVYIQNEHAGVSFSWNGNITVLKRFTYDTHLYSADSLKVGLRLPENNGDSYDALMIASFERYTHGTFRTIDRYLETRRVQKRKDTFSRTEIESSKKMRLAEIMFEKDGVTYTDPRKVRVFSPVEEQPVPAERSVYSGIEAVYAMIDGGGVVQIIAPQDRYGAVRSAARDLIASVKIRERI
ncbi:MAG: hypothetical protein ACOC2H_03905 [Spirochaetota bacterium]